MNEDELHDALISMHLRNEARIKEDFDRSLPFSEGMVDRWERAKRLGFSEGVSIYDSAIVFGKVKVGEQSWIGPSVILDGSGGELQIGGYCSISAGVHIYTHDTVMWALSGGEELPSEGKVIVGDRCHIGSQTTILGDVSIGDCCVVAANSVVKESVQTMTVVGGSPARKLGSVVFDSSGKPSLKYD